MKRKTNNVITLIGIASAIAASMCCIGPVLAFFAGASGLIAAFSLFEPIRPVLITVASVVLIMAWYRQLKPGIACDCRDGKAPFVQSKLFLAMVTALVAVILSFPYYASVFYPDTNLPVSIDTDFQDIQSAKFSITGMTCDGCAAHVELEATRLNGIINAEVFYKEGSAVVTFDASILSTKTISEMINSAGYKVANVELREPSP